jgi:hypothetical protein
VKREVRRGALLAAVWLAILLGAAVLVREAAKMPAPMPRDDLARTLRQLRSDVLEARTLALALATGQLTMHYAAQQHRVISDDLGDVRHALDKPPPRDGARQAEAARKAAERLDTLLESVAANLADAEGLRGIADEEAAIARDLPQARP